MGSAVKKIKNGEKLNKIMILAKNCSRLAKFLYLCAHTYVCTEWINGKITSALKVIAISTYSVLCAPVCVCVYACVCVASQWIDIFILCIRNVRLIKFSRNESDKCSGLDDVCVYFFLSLSLYSHSILCTKTNKAHHTQSSFEFVCLLTHLAVMFIAIAIYLYIFFVRSFAGSLALLDLVWSHILRST